MTYGPMRDVLDGALRLLFPLYAECVEEGDAARYAGDEDAEARASVGQAEVGWCIDQVHELRNGPPNDHGSVSR